MTGSFRATHAVRVSIDRPPVVVIDTTEFQQDLTLRRSAWQQARLWSLKDRLRLWVPEVVVREAVRHYRVQVTQQLGKLADAEDALSKLAWENRSPQRFMANRRGDAARRAAGMRRG